jgi:hypothetical protein
MFAPPVGSQPLPRWAQGPLLVPYRPGTLAYKLQVQDKEQDVLPHFPQLWTLPPAREGYGATTCFAALDPASLLGRALTLPRLPQLRTLPPRSGGLRCCHVSHGFRPYLLLRRAPTLPCVPWLWTLPPYSGGFQHCHVSRGFEPSVPTQEGSSAATCPMASDPASLLGWALTLPRVP